MAYYDRGDADTGEHLFDKPISVIQVLHDQSFLSGDLRESTSVRVLCTRSTVGVCLCARHLRGAHGVLHNTAGSSAGLFSHRKAPPWSFSERDKLT